MSVREELHAELEKMVENGLKNFHISWAEGAQELSGEERMQYVLDHINEMKKWHALSDEEKMRIQIKQAYGSLKKGIELCKFTVSETLDGNPEVYRTRLRTVFGHIEGAMLLLGNWVRNDR